MALTPKDVDEVIEQIKKLLEYWMRTKLVFIKAFGGEPVSREHEAAFLQLKSEISRLYRSISGVLPSGLNFDGDKMTEMLKNAMTMEHLQNQPLPERHKFYDTWHRVYVKLTRVLGALEVMQSGYYPAMHRDRLKPKDVPQQKKIMTSKK